MNGGALPALLVGALYLSACGDTQQSALTAQEIVEARVELGRYLFYDTRLSINEKRSCGICHEQAKGFTDGFPRAVGATHDLLPRNTLSLSNVGTRERLLWATTEPLTLKTQLFVPLLSTDPVEMGMGGGNESLLFERLSADADYRRRFSRAFPAEGGEITLDTIADAIVAFEQTLLSDDAPFDQFQRGEITEMTDAAARGMALFFGSRMNCYRCHSGPDFDSPAAANGEVTARHGAFNTGLFNVDQMGAYPEYDRGLIDHTGEPSDMGRFRTPTLRNVELTGPYTHDGTIASLEDMVRLYAAGGRDNESGPYIGDGRANPFKDPLITGFDATELEIADVVAFLHSLTDEAFITNPALSNPFPTVDETDDGSP